ncbi:hypothetical protein GGS24DRAFT_512247 [Hypoxylon argillaceum]|nr:hypothetical protein GGS24DRAFT_512247 [Hypoxylon argillaceum]
MLSDPFINPSLGSFSCISSIHPETKERSYSVSAYYQPVVKILFDKAESGRPIRALGVECKHEGSTFVAYASKEVILAAGPLQSPKILELSGIGDAQFLRELGIDVTLDLPAVGENLQDHAVGSICFEAIDTLDTLDALMRQEPEAIAQAMQDYGANRTGPMSHVGVSAYAYLPVNSIEGRQAVKEVLANNRPRSGEVSNLRDLAYFEVAERTLSDPNKLTAAYLTFSAQTAYPLPGKFLTIGAMLSQPLSRGTVHIMSSDYSAPPVIDPKYLSNPIDMEVLAQHMLEIERIARAPSFGKLLKQPLRHGNPASHFTSVEEAKQYLRDTVISMWHVGCTCVMLPREKGGVVDTDLKVYGETNNSL